MDIWVTIGLIAVLVIAAATLILFAIPKTRPYVKKLWPIAVILGGTVIVLVLFRRRPGKVGKDTSDLDKAIAQAQSDLNEALVVHELENKQIDKEYTKTLTELNEAKAINDPFDRHTAMRKTLERIRETN